MKTSIHLLSSCVFLAACAASDSPSNAPGQLSSSSSSSGAGQADWSRYFGERPACFAMYESASGQASASDPDRCDQRFLPFSTFKIPNALIGLETGVVADASTVIPWDRERYPPADWWPAQWRRDNDLRSAFRASAVPYFQAMAVRIGEAAMSEHVQRFDYGNADISGEVDQFWLRGQLGISAQEQIAFLRALHERRLPAKERNIAIVEDIMEWERGPGYVIRAKTGSGYLADKSALRWFVGHVERDQGADSRTVYFALNLSAADLDDLPREQVMELARTILRDMGALPADAPAQR